MKVVKTEFPEVLILAPKVHRDERGHFFESYNRRSFREATGLDVEFVQDNESLSARNALRGLHYQIKQAQGKLVRVVVGEIYDVAVDLRRSSPTFGKWTGTILSPAQQPMIWIPAGFAHGFLVLSEQAIVSYKATDYYAPEHERTLAWNDRSVGVLWPL
ncbi:MAG TPA: dTDP-4-dehydrorhamnose 3,5-epimerase, partial [Burkholderiales bacterium]|nr:dTDP-4-dehydrorhamnose 3,5-epimerase [Burkholderiales bacterium]